MKAPHSEGQVKTVGTLWLETILSGMAAVKRNGLPLSSENPQCEGFNAEE